MILSHITKEWYFSKTIELIKYCRAFHEEHFAKNPFFFYVYIWVKYTQNTETAIYSNAPVILLEKNNYIYWKLEEFFIVLYNKVIVQAHSLLK